MKINSIEDLRNHAIKTLEKLESKKIDMAEAGVTAKLYESLMSSLKTEMEYHKMLGHLPRIKFLEGATYELKEEKKEKLENQKKKIAK
ncbi:MAG: hypothetical protein KIH63_004670 [Candidatus Saccharibacteria bacterium]|nr:hypothetical protein [Candidatus Saccharibacteria bacterium]